MRPGVHGFSEQQSSAVAPSGSQAEKVDVAVVGSGFAGLCMGAHLKQAGRNSFVIIEKGDDVGGTWRDNRYPGCACDVPSHLYSLSFASKADWSRLYPSQPELFGYLRDVAKSYGLRPHIRFNTAMKRAEWSEPDGFWRVTASSGDVIAARVLVSCIGALHAPAYPSLPGIDRFRGTTFHSAKWPVDCDLRGRRVAVVGAGASAIQFVPQIAPEVEKLQIFQRTAPWVLPKGDRPIGRWERLLLGHLPGYNRAFRKWLHWRTSCA